MTIYRLHEINTKKITEKFESAVFIRIKLNKCAKYPSINSVK